MTADKERGLRTKHIIKTVLISIVASILLEAGTVWGSYDSSLFSLSCWSIRRLSVFFALSVLVTALIEFRAASDKGPERVPAKSLAMRFRHGFRTSVIPLAIGLCISGLIVVLVRLFTNVWDVRYGLCSFAFFLVAFLFSNKHEFLLKHVEWGFLSIAIPIGVLVCLLMPAFSSITWDGATHFDHANALSYIISPQYDGADKLMASTNSIEWHRKLHDDNPESISINSLDITVIDGINQSLSDAAATEEITKIDGMKTLRDEPMLSASTVGLLPQAVGLWIGRLFKLPPVLRYTTARLCNVLFYCLVFFFAIRRIRYGKLIVACIGLIPTTFCMAANFTYDPWHLAFITYAFSRYLGILQDEGATFQLKDGIIIASSFFLGAIVKAVVFPMAFVFLYMPKEKLASNVSLLAWRAIIGVMISLLLASFAVPFLFSGGSNFDDTRGGSNISGTGQLGYVLSHPIDFAVTLIKFLSKYLSVSQISLGVCFTAPYLYPDLSSAHYAIASAQLLLIVAVTLFDRDQSRSPKMLALLSILCGCCTIGLICLALYISYNPVGASSINGVQLRYIMPILPALLLICLNLPVSDTLSSKGRADLYFKAQTAVLILLIACVFVFRF